MFARFCFLPAIAALALVGCRPPAGSEPVGDPVVVVVTTSYPGASAQVMMESVAAPLEHRISRVANLMRIESESTSRGDYVAHVFFEPKTDPEIARVLVQNEVSLASPSLPGLVQREGTTVTVKQFEANPNVCIAVIDRGRKEWKDLQQVTAAVQKRLAAENAITASRIVAPDREFIYTRIEPEKCAGLKVEVGQVYAALGASGPPETLPELQRVRVRDNILLGDVAAFEKRIGPDVICRINQHPAVRVVGKPPTGASATDCTAKCLELATDELKQFVAGDFAAEGCLIPVR